MEQGIRIEDDGIVDDEDIVEKLKKWMHWADTIATTGLFFILLKYKLGYDSYFPTAWDLLGPASWVSFVTTNGMALPVALILLADFIIVRQTTKRHLELSLTAFSTSAAPQVFANVSGYKFIPVAIVMFYLLFLFFVISIHQPVLLCVGLLAWNAVDRFVAHVSIDAMDKFTKSKTFLPHTEDLHALFILQRREAAREYFKHWFYLPRIYMLAAGNLCALLLSLGWPFAAPAWVPYSIVGGLIIANESIMAMWKRKLERRFAAIRRAERRAILEKTGER